jgi:CDP-paratose synthetase
MRILLTGPSGFLGSALAHYWAQRDHELFLLARRNSRLDRLLADLGGALTLLRASCPDEVLAAVKEAAPDAIIHTACSYGRKGETSLAVMDANLHYGATLLQAALDGTTSRGGVTFLNTGTVLAPDVSLYALSKTQFSTWGAMLASQSPDRLRFIDVRLQQMYGPGDDNSKFTTHFLEACRRNEPRLALTAGEQRRDFIHIDDVVRAYDCILKHRTDFAASDSIDVGSGDAVTIRHFVEMAKELASASTVLEFGAVPYRANEAMLCVADTLRLRSLGWQPEVSLTDGISSLLKMPH